MFLVEHLFSFKEKYAEEVKEKLMAVYPESDVPLGNMLQPFIKKFRGTRSVAGASRCGRSEVLTEDGVVNMYDHIVRSPRKVCSQIVLRNRCLARINKERAYKKSYIAHLHCNVSQYVK